MQHLRVRSAPMRRQRGIGLVETALAMILISMVLLFLFNLWSKNEDGKRAENQAQVLNLIRESAQTLVFEHYDAYQAGEDITRNGITLPFGDDEGQALRPTVEQLNDLAVGLHNASSSPLYKSLAEGGYFIRINREPAGCEASPQGQECNITGHVCFDQPLRDPKRSNEDTDGFAIGRMLTQLGSNGGASVDDADGSTIYGYGGSWSIDNPIAGQPPGIVCARFGFGSAGFGNFLRVRDSRDPEFQNNVTLRGGLNIQRTVVNNEVCTADETGLIAQGVLAGQQMLFRCNGTIFEPVNGIEYGTIGGVCTTANQWALVEATGQALVCSNGRWVTQEGRGIRTMGYFGHGAVVPTPACPALHTPAAVVAAVSAANIIGLNNPGNNSGAFQAAISAGWQVTIRGSNGATAGTSALALVITSCNRT
ncbi:type II secretion system protein [Hydrogenophaga sp. NFH-34]|uniref:type II secretion system protein n=1 Tax=Hydrogenophaga sp. NFH-34 TaxID=2744446 RepID=UPI001F48EAD2|nr:type II secretion system protein [Hydrogenophaga sp. NFH-34]